MKIIERNGKVYIRHWGRWYVGPGGSTKYEKINFGDVDDLFDIAIDTLLEGKNVKDRKVSLDDDLLSFDSELESYVLQEQEPKPKRKPRKRSS